MTRPKKINIFLVIILLTVVAIIWWYSHLTHKTIKDELRNYNIEAIVGSNRLLIYRDLLQVFESGDLEQAEELIELMIKGEEDSIKQDLASIHLSDETKGELIQTLSYEPCLNED